MHTTGILGEDIHKYWSSSPTNLPGDICMIKFRVYIIKSAIQNPQNTSITQVNTVCIIGPHGELFTILHALIFDEGK